MNRRFSQIIAACTGILGALFLTAGCATAPQMRTVSSFLASGEGIARGKRTPTTTFASQDIIRFIVDVEWDDPTKHLGIHTVHYNWYAGTKLVSTFSGPYDFRNTPTELWTQRVASALGAGHFRAEISIDGKITASKEFEIAP